MNVLSRRVLPDEKNRRGWCPSLARPMPTGDGLLARVHPPLGVLSLAQLRAVAEGARLFGNGHVDVTARGNLQIRGVRERAAGGLAAWLARAGLGDLRDDGGPQRLTLTSPLAGLDADAAFDVTAFASAIEAEGRVIAGLPAKTLVAVVGAGVTGAGADIVVRLESAACVIALAGDEDDAIAVPGTGAAEAVGAMLHAFAATGRRRVRDLSRIERAEIVRIGMNGDRGHPPPPSAGEGGPCVGRGRERGKPFPEVAVPAPLPPRIREAPSPAEGGRFWRAVSLTTGLSELGSLTILAVEAPFGRCSAETLDRLAGTAKRIGTPDIRTTPARGFVLACDSRDAAEAALGALAAAGFVTRRDDPRRAVAACPGAPACASGTTPVPEHAAELARAFAPFAARGLTAHVSGCAKGCAHPAPTDLTLVAERGRYGIVLGGVAQDEPALRLTFEAALDRVRRADPAEPLVHAFRTDATPDITPDTTP